VDEEYMDRLYTSIMLAQVSGNAANAMLWAPDKLCIPWVSRYCPDVGDKTVPQLSRERYREILRHIWLRGADSMQIFNPLQKDQTLTSTLEVEDAVRIYDEVLAFRPFLDRGEIMNTAVPSAAHEGVVWSGLRLETEAIVRAFTQGRRSVRFSVRPWPAVAGVELDATPDGEYYHLSLTEKGVRVRKPRR
jgi:hypothetical protein